MKVNGIFIYNGTKINQNLKEKKVLFEFLRFSDYQGFI